MTNRKHIANLRQKIKEMNIDTDFTNQFLYDSLLNHAKWLVKREIRAGKVYKNLELFKTLKCKKVVEANIIDSNCPIQAPCNIWRTDKKLPDTWQDDYGPVIKYALSIDDSTRWHLISKEEWINKQKSPYAKFDKTKYMLYNDGYLWFPKQNPRLINIYGYWIEDVEFHNDCGSESKCVRFLDTEFNIPEWIEAEMYSKALEELVKITKQLPADEQIDNNTSRKQ
jgi:hypothetical protein